METYFRNLLRSLQDVDSDNDYQLVCNARYLDSLGLERPNFRHATGCCTKPSPAWYLRVALRDATGLDLLRRVIFNLKADIVHHPFSLLNPPDHRTRSVLTFIDLQHEYFPEYFSAGDLKARRQRYRSSAQQATRIIAISGHVKQSLVERYGVDPDKVDAIHIGYGPQFQVLDNTLQLEEVKKRYGLQRPFLYYPAATWPHKNHKRLLAALKLMKERHGFTGQLVLSGIAKQSNDEVLEEVARLNLRNDVIALGYLPQEDLPVLYNLARLMAFPSRFEGFGIPLVEAMACGCPVACAGVTSIPEVVGDAALLFDPDCTEEIAENLCRLWDDEVLRTQLAERGLARARCFSWQQMARETVAVYRKALQA